MNSLLVGRARARPVLERELAAAPELRGAPGERLGQQRDRLGAVSAQLRAP